MTKIVDRYILGIFLKMFLAVLTVLLTLFEVITFFDLIDDFVRYKAAASVVVWYFVLKMPEAAYNMAPMATLIGGILTFSIISRNKEVIILFSSGMSVWRLALPVLLASAVISGLVFANSEYLLPQTSAQARQIFHKDIRKASNRPLIKEDKVWIRSGDGKIWNIGLYNLKDNRLRNVVIVDINHETGELRTITHARAAGKTEGGWELRKGYQRTFGGEEGFQESRFATLQVNSPLHFDQIKEAEKLPQEMNFNEIKSYVGKVREAGFDDTRYTVDMMSKITFPLVNIVMALIAIPFSLKTERAAGNLVGVALGMFIGFVFWFFYSMGLSLGHNGKIPPLYAVSFAHILFLLFALTVIDQRYGSILYRVRKLFR